MIIPKFLSRVPASIKFFVQEFTDFVEIIARKFFRSCFSNVTFDTVGTKEVHIFAICSSVKYVHGDFSILSIKISFPKTYKRSLLPRSRFSIFEFFNRLFDAIRVSRLKMMKCTGSIDRSENSQNRNEHESD